MANAMPLFNPYHQFKFSSGFIVIPQPTGPYVPTSDPRFLQFVPNYNTNGNNTQAGPDALQLYGSGQISDGDDAITGCFTFNLYGAAFGCDSSGPGCDFSFTGYTFDIKTKKETLVAALDLSIPACASRKGCSLTKIELDDTFQDLTHIRINATVASEPKTWYMDDLNLGWFNNTCAAGMCRINTHIHKLRL